MAETPPLLKKDGKLARKDGKLVRTKDPSQCSCCGEKCDCLTHDFTILSFRLEDSGDQILVVWTVKWDAPEECDLKYDFEFEYYNKAGELLGRSNEPATVGESTHDLKEEKDDVCNKPDSQIHTLKARIVDLNGPCRPGAQAERSLDKDSLTYTDLCPPPPDGYVCQGPFSGIWECAPCNDCVGNAETYATLEECEAACQPPDKDCCVECDSGTYPESCDGCPEGYDCHDIGGAFFCIASTPVECGFAENGDWLQDTLDALKACEDKGGTGTATQAPCRQPPKQECCLVCELPGPPPEQCPEGFFFASNGLCQKYFPTDCSDEQIAEAARQCSASWMIGPPEAPCPEPPPTTSCAPAACPPDKYCTFHHPDCGPGECCPTGVWDTLEEAQGVAASFPYDAFSKQSCEAWYQENYPGPCEGRMKEGGNPLP